MFPKVVVLFCFLLFLTALIASASQTIDTWIALLLWSALLVGSVLLLVKNIRRSYEGRRPYFGQLALLPRSWQQWILGEEISKKRGPSH